MKQPADISFSGQQALCVMLDKLRVRHCLLLGSDEVSWLTSCPGCSDIAVDSRSEYSAADLPQPGEYDFVVLLNLLEGLPKKTAEHYLAFLRDLHGGCFALVFHPELVDAWQSKDLLALGLYQLPLPEPVEQIFVFDIHTYKQTPDWLNSEYWAHPELFDKYRW